MVIIFSQEANAIAELEVRTSVSFNRFNHVSVSVAARQRG